MYTLAASVGHLPHGALVRHHPGPKSRRAAPKLKEFRTPDVVSSYEQLVLVPRLGFESWWMTEGVCKIESREALIDIKQ